MDVYNLKSKCITLRVKNFWCYNTISLCQRYFIDHCILRSNWKDVNNPLICRLPSNNLKYLHITHAFLSIFHFPCCLWKLTLKLFSVIVRFFTSQERIALEYTQFLLNVLWTTMSGISCLLLYFPQSKVALLCVFLSRHDTFFFTLLELQRCSHSSRWLFSSSYFTYFHFGLRILLKFVTNKSILGFNNWLFLLSTSKTNKIRFV